MKKIMLFLIIALIAAGCSATFYPSGQTVTDAALADSTDQDLYMQEKPYNYDQMIEPQGEPEKEPYRKENLEQREEEKNEMNLIHLPGKPNVNTEE